MNETPPENKQALRQLPALEQIKLALEYRGYLVRTQSEQSLLVDLPEARLQLSYLDCDGSQNQLLEVLMPLDLLPDEEQFRSLTPTLAILNRTFGGLSLVSGAEGLSLRCCTLHPRQLPDLKYLLGLIRSFIQAWACSYSLLAPYLKGQVGIDRLQLGQPL